MKHLWDALPHYNWQTRGRHLFLATGDIKDLPVEIQGQPLVLPLSAPLVKRFTSRGAPSACQVAGGFILRRPPGGA